MGARLRSRQYKSQVTFSVQQTQQTTTAAATQSRVGDEDHRRLLPARRVRPAAQPGLHLAVGDSAVILNDTPLFIPIDNT